MELVDLVDIGSLLQPLLIPSHELVEFGLIESYTIDFDLDRSIKQMDTMTIDVILARVAKIQQFQVRVLNRVAILLTNGSK